MKTYKGVEYAPKNIDGVMIELTDVECEAQLQKTTTWNNAAPARALADLRTKRNRLLAETDYLALSDSTLSDDMKTYRQNLRDLPAGKDTVAKCEGATWPTKP